MVFWCNCQILSIHDRKINQKVGFFSFSIHHMFVAEPIILLKMKKNWKKFVNSFKPSYKVDVTVYHFIPGMPVKENKTRHSFKKGAFKEAKLFFDQASAKTKDHNIAPVEINLVRGRRKIVTSCHFGPVKNLKQMRMSA